MPNQAVQIHLPSGSIIRMAGVSGAGMSALAHLCLDQGYQVEGQDQQANQWTQALINRGMQFKLESVDWPLHDAVKVMVYSSAIGPDHKIRQSKVPQLKRGDFLGHLVYKRSLIAIGGTHGKTSITSLCAYVFREVGMEVGFLVGGQADQLPRMGVWGHPDQPFIAEADESDGSILAFNPQCLLISSIEPDHLENHGNNFQQLVGVFSQSTNQIHKQGAMVACLDCPQVRQMIQSIDRPVITYGFDQGADIQCCQPVYSGSSSDCVFMIRDQKYTIKLSDLSRHSVQNIAGALAICDRYQLPMNQVASAISAFKGVKRRMERLPDLRRSSFQIPVIEDYGHHPTSIQSIITNLQANEPDRHLVMVFQPHRYSRTEALFAEFVSVLSMVDHLILLPIYSHGEPKRPVSSQALADAILARHPDGQIDCIANDQLANTLTHALMPKSLLLIQGAGTVGKLFESVLKILDPQL